MNNISEHGSDCKATIPWTELNAPPLFPGLLPKPTYYKSKDDNKEYCIITPHYANSKIVLKYDMESDIYLNFVNYPENFNPNCHGSAFNPQNDKLYLYAGYSRHFGILNIKTKKWDIKWDKKHRFTKENEQNFNIPFISKVSSSFIPSPINEIHLFGYNTDYDQSQHIKYDKINQKFVVIHIFKSIVQRPKMVWIEKQNKLMILGGYNENLGYLNNIYFCNIDTNTTEYEWKQFEKTLPNHNKNNFEAVVVFDTILIVIYFGDKNKNNEMNEIWCLDLLNNKWVKSDIQSPSDKNMHLIQTSNNYLHCIKFTADPKHYKIKLTEIIPNEFHDEYSKRYLVLIYGYCRQCQTMYESLHHVPTDIIKLILKYYPIFA